MGDKAPFFSKGRGQSYMVSDFLVSHPPGPFFSFTRLEFEQATRKYPELLSHTDLSYVQYSATSGIHVGQDAYFNNATILQQFERLFQLLSFKSDFQGHDIEVVVDNARTHTAKEYSIHDFGKGIGTRCPVDYLEFLDDHGKSVRISCYFSSGPHRGRSKGLLMLAKVLKIPVHDSIQLKQLQQLINQHPAFQNVGMIPH